MAEKSTESRKAGSSEYFDLQTIGLGYLNRAREVPTRGEPFLAVDIAALHGAKDNVQYTRFDCIVRGKKAKALVMQLKPEIDAGKSVLIGFRLGDLYAETFKYTNGDKAGETGVSLKARLLKIVWARVDGETVYSARTDQGEGDATPAPGQAREQALATAHGAAARR